MANNEVEYDAERYVVDEETGEVVDKVIGEVVGSPQWREKIAGRERFNAALAKSSPALWRE